MFSFLSNVFAANSELAVGDKAPSFTLLNQSAKNISLQDYQGKWVVLYFYPKDDTPGCTTEACSFRDNINHLIAQQAVVLGVSLDSQKSHEEFAKTHNLPFDLLADESGEVTKQYGSLLDLKILKFAKRHSFIIDPKGHIAKIYRDVNPKEHVAKVMEDLQQLQKNGD
ncbi:peroxiredoxin [Thiomicrorhabdus sp. Milos-T2]|uniref:peroxiredoxin n=1 Tax=Thiomicrorhabdus sp. Milos-T2 TaxID=90814 RepID=UPI000AA95F7E|nr:peroxiredoxin [Thiomicrorhabdus sp. Milos-T2]